MSHSFYDQNVCYGGQFSDVKLNHRKIVWEENAGMFSKNWGAKCVVVRPSFQCKSNGKTYFVIVDENNCKADHLSLKRY